MTKLEELDAVYKVAAAASIAAWAAWEAADAEVGAAVGDYLAELKKQRENSNDL